MDKKLHKYSSLRKAVTCNKVGIYVSIANTNQSRMTGLSHTASLPDNEGMLFDFTQDQSISLWMPNMNYNLSVAFITAEGKIIDIQSMSKDNPTRLHSSPIPVRYALEVNEGFFNKNNIKTGDIISL